MTGWVKGFLILYLLLAVFVSLVASDQYQRYVKFFSGLLLMMYFLVPVLRFFGQGDQLQMSNTYEEFWESLDGAARREGFSYRPENDSVKEQYERALGMEVVQYGREQGVALDGAQVWLSEDYEIEQIELRPAQDAEKSSIEEFAKLLGERYRVDADQICICETD